MRILFLLALCAGFFSLPAGSGNLEIYFIDTGQGDATLLVAPTGQTFLFDGGDNGDGNADVVPLLNSLGITHLDYVGVSHYHADHLGGLDEVWNAGITATTALDRGFNNTPGTQSYNDYANRYSSVRQAVTPGQVISLGGGVTLTCIVSNGQLMGGGSVNINSSSQWENSSSVGWRVDYGDFQMWMGGDLTGGGNSTTDVESSVGPLVGDVDVYQVNHHGSRTSTNSNWVNALKPEFSVIPCGHSNPYGYPKQEVTDRLNTATHVCPVWCPTDGVGTEGFVDAGGDIHLSTDGDTYTVTASDGTTFTMAVDERSNGTPGSGDLVVAEFLPNPGQTSDSDGEWVEIAGTDNGFVSLENVKLTDFGSNNATIGAPMLLDQGIEIVIAADGLAGRNGGVRPHMVWPSNTFSMGNSSDTVALQHGGSTLDRVDYTSSWPFSNGVSAERKDLLGSNAASNFTAATANFGNGDKGTPGSTNTSDTTVFGGGGSGLDINILTSPVVGQMLDMEWLAPGEAGYFYQGFITLRTSPGFDINGVHISGNQDRAYNLTVNKPGFFGTVPASEAMYVSGLIPNRATLHNAFIYAVFYTFETPGTIVVREVSAPALMQII
ncbi:MAG: MBL fold metallo-hydrolase [Planctomycetes bacterium]|nr:MBL fold metallo-hydrolase [Planctomycetota bacterium]MCP4771239.1 MBL fold metallo-hydrolase [Planctomycetota bacterium]MCP4862034.1 MBL fold metallo-hydrolase [Planctomycetota bacterium]